jgi:hypothetical protein
MGWYLGQVCRPLLAQITKFGNDLREETSDEPRSLVTQTTTARLTTSDLRSWLQYAQRALAAWEVECATLPSGVKFREIVEAFATWLARFDRAIEQSLQLGGDISPNMRDDRLFKVITAGAVKTAFSAISVEMPELIESLKACVAELAEFDQSERSIPHGAAADGVQRAPSRSR